MTKILLRSFILFSLVSVSISCTNGPSLKEYLITGSRPNKLYLIDAADRKIIKGYDLPGPGVPSIIVPAPDPTRAYVLTSSMNSIIGMDLISGKPFFQADLSHADVRSRALNFALTPDGKEIYVYEYRTQILPDQYQVLPPRISVFQTNGGLQAKPVRSFAAPRRISNLMFSGDGARLYAPARDLLTLDPDSGAILDSYPVMSKLPENYLAKEWHDPFKSYEQANTYATMIYATRSDIPETETAAYESHYLSLDLETGEIKSQMFENTTEVIFNFVISPNKKEAFGVYTTLAKIDMEKSQTVQRVELDHTYYLVNVSGDGKEVYVGGTMCDIGIYSAESLEKTGAIELPGCPDMVAAAMRMITLPTETVAMIEP